jgi:ubiquinone biosynthesis protein COQ4
MNLTSSATDTRLHPITAFRAVRALMADGEDTNQVFIIFRALRGNSGQKIFKRFKASPTGQKILRENRSLMARLEDRAALAALPQGSVGRAYFEFMESEHLSAAGLMQASEGTYDDVASPEAKLVFDRLRDAHDLTHILTGYGRDPLGELCLLAFMHQHSHNLGQKLIIAMSWSRLPQAARKAVKEAGRNGKKARWFLDMDYEALLSRPLDEVRRELNIAEPSVYRACAQ